jgi:hypothetical protein
LFVDLKIAVIRHYLNVLKYVCSSVQAENCFFFM